MFQSFLEIYSNIKVAFFFKYKISMLFLYESYDMWIWSLILWNYSIYITFGTD